jgi:hypothetical protein
MSCIFEPEYCVPFLRHPQFGKINVVLLRNSSSSNVPVSASYLSRYIVFWRYLLLISAGTLYFGDIYFISQPEHFILEISVSYLNRDIVFWRYMFHISAGTLFL